MSSHGHGHGVPVEPAEFWEQHYRAAERVWSGRANPVLVDEVGPLPAGRALDLGCGEGGDAVWLAERGWRVTAVDVSATALARVAERAAAAGVAGRVEVRRADLADGVPAGPFDLVSAQYLHSPVELPREQVLRAAAAAVAPGGLLLVVGHLGFPSWAPEPGPDVHFPTPDDVVASLDLPAGEWLVERADAPERPATAPDGSPATLVDSVVRLRRR